MVCSWDGTGFGPTAVSQQLLELDDDERNAVFTVMLARKPRLQPRFGVSFSLQFANRPRATMARRDGPPDIGSQEPGRRQAGRGFLRAIRGHGTYTCASFYLSSQFSTGFLASCAARVHVAETAA